MLAALLARYAHGQREVDRYAAWTGALERFRDDWQNGKRFDAHQLRDYLDGIPQEQQPQATQDLIAEHLRLTWQSSRGTRLEEYFPGSGNEAASLASISAEMIEDEFLARYQLPHGDMPSIDEYQRRFPSRTDVMQQLMRRCLDGGRMVKLHKRGLGAFGEVWEAHDCQAGGRVVIKEPRGDLPSKTEALRRFAEEDRLMASLEHSGIVALRKHQPCDGSGPLYVMRLVNGETLSQWIRSLHLPPDGRRACEQRRAWKQTLEAFVKICETMEYAHARGVLHRDLKPGNVVLEANGNPVILDWGMATRQSKAAEFSVTSRTGEVGGTPDYMPPEQADGVADARSDVFGLGAILYEILTGRSPHGWADGTRPGDWQRQVRQAHFSPPHQLRPQTPRPLEAICMKALARDPKDRFPTASALAAEVRRHVSGDSESATTAPLGTRVWNWVAALVGDSRCLK